MRTYFGYIRVSTQRQGVHGVSLQEQKSAIEAYAKRAGYTIVSWYEERETAAKRGRRVFSRMLRELGRGKVDGVVIHKIDRGARNPYDWAELGELIDRGIDVHFAHDALDMRSRGGRLTADIQAVIAADYIRNLREETRKGFYGRLKQGLYPLRAPIGYRDTGRGRVKEIDPIQGPLVRETFELYATGEWNFLTLQLEMCRRGLRGRRGASLSLNGFTTMLNNPFYIGLIHIRKTGETFEGKHKSLIDKALYDRVQMVLRGRREGAMPLKHDFLFRRLFRCSLCGRCLVGEKQKERYVYYRCHSVTCQGTTLSEIAIDARIRELFSLLQFDPEELRDLRDMMESLRASNRDDRSERERSVRLRMAQHDVRIARLTDAVIDGLIDKSSFDERKAKLLTERRGLLDRLQNIESEPSLADVIAETLELSNVAQLSYESGIPAEKRDAVLSLSSNCSADRKKPVIMLKSPYRELAIWRISQCCDPYRDTVRTRAEKIFSILQAAAEKEAEAWQHANDYKRITKTPLDSAA